MRGPDYRYWRSGSALALEARGPGFESLVPDEEEAKSGVRTRSQWIFLTLA